MGGCFPVLPHQAPGTRLANLAAQTCNFSQSASKFACFRCRPSSSYKIVTQEGRNGGHEPTAPLQIFSPKNFSEFYLLLCCFYPVLAKSRKFRGVIQRNRRNSRVTGFESACPLGKSAFYTNTRTLQVPISYASGLYSLEPRYFLI